MAFIDAGNETNKLSREIGKLIAVNILLAKTTEYLKNQDVHFDTREKVSNFVDTVIKAIDDHK